ncbi:hypothetical protein B0H14DRAFT_2608838 [Mycena olivaceomarginata]|nr:hypothetical protein B0H14DRAFT_2608838 [Mycena olivaceomarginata]
MSSFYILGFFPRNAPPSFIPHPRNVAASESSISTSLAQEDSAFNHSATNPYNYPMTQIDIQIKVFQPSGKTNFNLHCLLDLSNKLPLPLSRRQCHPLQQHIRHTGTHGGNHGSNFHTFGLIGVRDCGTNWPRPEPSFEEELIASQLALC